MDRVPCLSFCHAPGRRPGLKGKNDMPLRFLTAGESHGPALLAILEGLPAGLPLDPEQIDRDLARRQRGYGAGPRMKLEQDRVEILSGMLEGHTTGAPLGLRLENQDHARWKGLPV